MNAATYSLLTNTLIEYDSRSATRARYDRYALPRMFERLLEVRADVEQGRPLRQAIIVGFCGRLQLTLLRAIGEPHATDAERRGVYAYKPVTAVCA